MRCVVLVSGSGTLLQALLDAVRTATEPVLEIVAVGSDRVGTRGLERARAAGLPTFVVPLAAYEDRAAWDGALAGAVAPYAPDLVVSAGFMKVLGPAVLAGAPVLNAHPSLLPAFPGAHAVRDALAYGVKVTGCTVHLVDEGVDTGPVLAQRAVEVLDDDDEATLHERIKVAERELLVDVVGRVARGGMVVEGRRVRLP